MRGCSGEGWEDRELPTCAPRSPESAAGKREKTERARLQLHSQKVYLEGRRLDPPLPVARRRVLLSRLRLHARGHASPAARRRILLGALLLGSAAFQDAPPPNTTQARLLSSPLRLHAPLPRSSALSVARRRIFQGALSGPRLLHTAPRLSLSTQARLSWSSRRPRPLLATPPPPPCPAPPLGGCWRRPPPSLDPMARLRRQ